MCIMVCDSQVLSLRQALLALFFWLRKLKLGPHPHPHPSLALATRVCQLLPHLRCSVGFGWLRPVPS